MLLIEVLATTPSLFIAIAVILGLIIGSFLNVVIYRLPIMMENEGRAYCAQMHGYPDTPAETFNLIKPNSRCNHCGRAIRPHENIPLISYILLRGRCTCGQSISIRYPLIEALTGLLTGIVAWHFGFGLQAIAAMVLTWALIALSGIDFEHKLLPDSLTLPFVWIGLLLALLPVFADLHSSVIGAAAGYLSLWSVYWLFKLLTKKEGMGYGDFKLLAVFGAWLGWQSLVAIIILSSLVGSIIGIGLIVFAGRDHSIPMPFGPFLAIAGWVVMLWGDRLQSLYLQLLGLS